MVTNSQEPITISINLQRKMIGIKCVIIELFMQIRNHEKCVFFYIYSFYVSQNEWQND